LPEPWLGVVVVPVDGAIVTLGVVVVVDVEPVPVAPRATAPTAPPPNIAATTPAVTRPLWILVMNLLLRLLWRLARADQRPLRVSFTPPKRSHVHSRLTGKVATMRR
jgi:hypothetical protein